MGSISPKADRSERAAEAALILIEKFGLKRLTIAQVARLSKVSRPWIYKYIGSSQRDLIDFAVDHFGRLMADLDRRSDPKSPNQWISSALSGTRHIFEVASARPWLVSLYFRYRGTSTVPGKRIAILEAEYLRVFARETKESLGFSERYSLFLAQSITAVRMGLAHQWVSSPKQDSAQLEKLLELVEAVLIRMVESGSAAVSASGAKTLK